MKTCKQPPLNVMIIASFLHARETPCEKTQTSDCKIKVPASGPNTFPQPSMPLVNHIVNDRLLHATPRFSIGAARLMQLLQEII